MAIPKPILQDIDLVYERSVVEIVWYYLNPDGSPVNLTDYTAKLSIRNAYDDAGGVLVLPVLTTTATASGSVITLDPTTGKITAHFAAADSVFLYPNATRTYYDLFLTPPITAINPNDPYCAFYGAVAVQSSVSD